MLALLLAAAVSGSPAAVSGASAVLPGASAAVSAASAVVSGASAAVSGSAAAISAAPAAVRVAQATVVGPTPGPKPPVAAILPSGVTPQRLLGLIRAKFRSHRPPPPFEIYTLERKQLTDQGFPDYAESYTTKYWVRNLDRAALTRRVYRRGAVDFDVKFDRPAFNEDRDPGPPTADVFEPAPVRPRPITFVPTPEPGATQLPTIGSVTVSGEFDYRVESVTSDGGDYHVTLVPTRDPDRNRLRELWVNKASLEPHKIVATDKLFVLGTRTDVYGVTFTITLSSLAGVPIVTDIHGVVGDGYSGDGATVDYTFRGISFPPTLPGWYFDPSQYGQHQSEKPL